MATLITGRRIDPNGNPIDGTGFEYDSDNRLAELLNQRVSPLMSQPITGEWVFGLVTPKESNGAFERGVGIFPPGNAGPAEHIHPSYDEHFEVVQGEFIFKIDGQEQPAGAGERLVVKKGTPHAFRCVGAACGAVIAGLLTPQGQPRMMHAMVIGSEYADDTVFTSPPPSIAIPMAKMLAPISRMLGNRATNPKYADPSWWAAHVEQPK
jgi:quercetin dioxygenase-like cupin family protein